MLKKIIKYGNSHVLILDKGLLDLLNLQEGSLVKIKSDGASFTVTPYKNLLEGHYIPSSVAFEDTGVLAAFEAQFKKNLMPTLTEEQKVMAYARFKAAAIAYIEASRKLALNGTYQQGLEKITEQYKDAPLSCAALEASQALRNHCEPGFSALEDELNAAIACSPVPMPVPVINPSVVTPVQENNI